MKKRILVIDDEEAIRQMFSSFFEEHNFEVTTASNGVEALNILKETSFDLIFLDLRMPEMDGIEVFRKTAEFDKDTPVYIMTGFEGEYESRLKQLQDEGMEFELLIKPIKMDQLLALVNNLLEKHPDEIIDYNVCLYKIGNKPTLEDAYEKLKNYLTKSSKMNFSFETIDCLQNPQAALEANIIATPTIVKLSPLPSTRVVGSIVDYQKVTILLGIL
jgi:DNA-binding response OmpR family regulator